jgi:hypothetical protein
MYLEKIYREILLLIIGDIQFTLFPVPFFYLGCAIIKEKFLDTPQGIIYPVKRDR